MPDDPDVTDIHIRDFDPVWLKRLDGSRLSSGPVADSDDDLVQTVRMAATRMDAASAESTWVSVPGQTGSDRCSAGRGLRSHFAAGETVRTRLPTLRIAESLTCSPGLTSPLLSSL